MSDPNKPRPDGRSAPSELQVRPSVADRFGGLAPRAPSSEARPSAARFEPPGEQLELARSSDTEQPFVKCARCGNDASRFAQQCPTCGAGFDTADQRAFNERLWAERQREREQEQRAAASRLAANPGASAPPTPETSAWDKTPLDESKPLLLTLFRTAPPWGPLLGVALLAVALLVMRYGGWFETYQSHYYHRRSYLGWSWFGLLLLGFLLVPPSIWKRGAR